MLALLRTRRWIGFSVLVVVAIVGFGLLSRWQWSRAEEKRTQKAQLVEESALAPVPVTEVLPPGTAWHEDLEWRTVTATGSYLPDEQVLVRKRPLEGQNGFWVATPLSLDSGGWVWVNRGWVAAQGSATDVQEAPPPPDGPVVVTGRLRPPQDGPDPLPTDLPAGQVVDLDIDTLTPSGTPVLDGYVERVSSQPADDPALRALPVPEIDEGRNVSYAVQWILFAVVALVGWFYFLRRESREDAAAEARTEGDEVRGDQVGSS